jgi:hypothetical protein
MQTYRDAEIVEWIGRLGALGAEHVMRRFEMGRSVTYDRLHSLTCDGLLAHHQVLFGRPGVYTATSAGLRWRNLSHLGVCGVRPAGFEHAWQVARTAVELEEVLPEWDLVSEREIRWVEADSRKPYASAQVGQADHRPKLHRPDLALAVPREDIVVPIEIELSTKSASRLATICRGWARARHISNVYYLAAPGPRRAVQRAVRAARATDCVTVLHLDDAQTLADLQYEREVVAGVSPDQLTDADPETYGVQEWPMTSNMPDPGEAY